MLNKQNLIICDTCNNILNDGRTLLPGYLVIDNGLVTEYRSIDPNNQYDTQPQNPRLDLPRNRLTSEGGENYMVSKILTVEQKVKEGDFCNLVCALDK